MAEYGRIHTDGSRSGGQPVEAQQRALAIANTLLGIDRATLGELSHHELMMALVRIVPQHDAARQELSDFKQEVSDAVWDYYGGKHIPRTSMFAKFSIPKPDPLVEALHEVDTGPEWDSAEDYCNKVRAALDKLGFEIREKNDDRR